MTHFADWKLGASSCSIHEANPEMLRAYAEAGIPSVELSLAFDRMDEMDFDALEKASKETGVEIWSLHLPFDNTLAIAHADENARIECVRQCIALLKQCGEHGIKHAVIHPGTEPNEDKDKPARLEEAKMNLNILTEAAMHYGVTLCVEELPRTCVGNCTREIAYLLTAHPALKVCFDTNHLLGEDYHVFIREFGDRIETLHVSDYDFIDERHQLPGEGKIDWKDMITELEKVNYKGPWMYEVSLENFPNRRTAGLLKLTDFPKNKAWLETLVK